MSAHDLTKLFAGIATCARQIFGIRAEQVHVDTTSFSVSGQYAETQEGEDPTVIAITYGYSRDHRADLKQWMLSLERPAMAMSCCSCSPWMATALIRSVSFRQSLPSRPNCWKPGKRPVYLADNGIYSEANFTHLNRAHVKWVSRVSETMTEARTLIQEGSQTWQQSEDGPIHWFSRELKLPQDDKRWVVVYTQASLQRAQQTLQRQESKAQTSWEQRCWHLTHRCFACKADARQAVERELKEKPDWLDIHSDLVAHPEYEGRGRPRKDASPVKHQWQMMATVSVNLDQVAQEAFRRACWIVGTNVLEPTALSG